MSLRVPGLRRRGLLFAAFAASISAASARAAMLPGVQFLVTRAGPTIDVQASAVVRADATTVWNTLVDYARLPDFIPGMLSSQPLERHGDDLLVRQVGRAGFGPFEQAFSLTLAVREFPMREVAARAIDGDFDRFESSYLISAAAEAGAATRLDYLASIEPKGGIPPLVGVPVMRRVMRQQFDALLAEVERRAGATP